MFNNLSKMKELGAKTYQTSTVLEGKVSVHIGELYIGKDKLSDLEGEFVTCYGKKVKVEIKVTVNL